MAQKYKNIPVKPDVYVNVQMIANLNNRGLGDQVKAWTERDLPECSHKKQPVTIETFGDEPKDSSVTMKGLYCPTCKRVYQYVSDVADQVAS